MNSHDVKAVVEVCTEAPFLNGTLQIAVGGGYDPNINRNRCDSSHSFEFAFLKKPQELGLQFLGNIADLIEKDCSPLGQFYLARLTSVGASKRALFLAESFALQEFSRQPHRIDSDNG